MFNAQRRQQYMHRRKSSGLMIHRLPEYYIMLVENRGVVFKTRCNVNDVHEKAVERPTRVSHFRYGILCGRCSVVLSEYARHVPSLSVDRHFRFKPGRSDDFFLLSKRLVCPRSDTVESSNVSRTSCTILFWFNTSDDSIAVWPAWTTQPFWRARDRLMCPTHGQ